MRSLKTIALIGAMGVWLVGCGAKSIWAQATQPVGFEKGVVEGNTYKNASLGLELTPASGIKLGQPEINGTLVKVWGQGEKRWFSVSQLTVFYAEALTFYPQDWRTTEKYMHMLSRSNTNQGFMIAKEPSNEQLGGMVFSRADFKKPSLYEATFLRACSSYAFVFIFRGADLEEVNGLVSRATVKLDPQRSGCGAK